VRPCFPCMSRVCPRVSRACPVCVPAPPGVFLPVSRETHTARSRRVFSASSMTVCEEFRHRRVLSMTVFTQDCHRHDFSMTVFTGNPCGNRHRLKARCNGSMTVWLKLSNTCTVIDVLVLSMGLQRRRSSMTVSN
jgi:hypothetical protein